MEDIHILIYTVTYDTPNTHTIYTHTTHQIHIPYMHTLTHHKHYLQLITNTILLNRIIIAVNIFREISTKI